MTVTFSKPAVNLRDEVTSLKAQVKYEEQKFYYDNLVTNGTFDSDISGWTISDANGSIVWDASGAISLTGGSGEVYAAQGISTVVGSTYRVSIKGPSSPNIHFAIGTTVNGQQILYVALTGTGTYNFTASSNTTYLSLREFAGTGPTLVDDISVFESDGTDVVHYLPKGWKPKDIFEDGLLQREGANNDYEVIYDGFVYYVKPTVAPGPATETCIVGVRK